jgi:hypothetical protein
MDTESDSFIPVGTLVIMQDKQRGYVERVTLESGKPVYSVGMKDGSERVVDAAGLMSAKAYAEMVAPGSNWDGDERRKGERRVGDRRTGDGAPEPGAPNRREGERRKGDRRKPAQE